MSKVSVCLAFKYNGRDYHITVCVYNQDDLIQDEVDRLKTLLVSEYFQYSMDLTFGIKARNSFPVTGVSTNDVIPYTLLECLEASRKRITDCDVKVEFYNPHVTVYGQNPVDLTNVTLRNVKFELEFSIVGSRNPRVFL